MITVNILGSCVIRDIFEIEREKISEKYKVGHFIQSNNIMTLNCLPLSNITHVTVEQKEMSSVANVWYRWARANMEKMVFSTLQNNNADFLLIGLTETVYDFYKVTNSAGMFTYLSSSAFRGLFYKIFSQEKFSDLYFERINTIDYLQTIDGKKMLEEVLEYVENEILKIYRPEQIILVEHYWAAEYVDEHGNINLFKPREDTKLINNVLNFSYEHFRNRVKPLVIHLPEYTIGDSKNKWGIDPQHYISEAYDYLYSACNVCVSNDEEKQIRLNSLYCEFERYLAEFKATDYVCKCQYDK